MVELGQETPLPYMLIQDLKAFLLDIEEEVDGVACAIPDDLTLPLLPDFGFFLGTSNSAEIGSQYRALSFRAANLAKTCW